MPRQSDNYTELRRQLDDVLAQLQDPECDVDEAATLFEKALEHITKLEQHLQKTENRVKKAQVDFSNSSDLSDLSGAVSTDTAGK